MSQFKKISQEQFAKEATPDKVVISRSMSPHQYDVTTKTHIELTIEEVVEQFLKENAHADYLCATVFFNDFETHQKKKRTLCFKKED